MNGHDRHATKHTRHARWQFNPYEIAVTGARGDNRAALVVALTRALSRDLKLGCVKCDVPEPDPGRPGKDGDRLRDAGATTVLHTGGKGWELATDDDTLAAYSLLAADAVLVEGPKGGDLPGLLLLDEGLAALEDPSPAALAPIAVVHPFAGNANGASRAHAQVVARFGDVPWFERDAIAEIAQFIRNHWRTRVPPLKGLVLAGGRSTRMQRDKALLDYHGCSQIDFSFRLLSEICPQVFLSCRPDQQNEASRRTFPILTDQFLEMGPTSGILSALATGLQQDDGPSAWLVLACDLPKADSGLLRLLVANRNPFRLATTFRGGDGFPEPLCSIWEPKSFPRLLQFLGLGRDCPRKCLINSSVALLDPPTAAALDNGNTPADFERLRHDLVLGS